MMLAIAILGLIGLIASVRYYISEHDRIDVNTFLSAITVIAWWNICLPISIILIILFILILINAINKNN